MMVNANRTGVQVMRKLRTAIALAVSLAMAGCSTLDNVTVNGREVNKDIEQAQLGNCGVLCIAGIIAAGVLIWVLVDDDDDDDESL
jgi:hypothetical protein